ncbi:PTS sugar transporter subunit IIA [Candidatus Fermentibacterales bacterium]|nr:PTS sugar transporter subunit IIA [Candidatus Fermentibacterales bacterium]
MERRCRCVWKLSSTDRKAAVRELLDTLPLADKTKDLLTRALETREQAGPTVIRTGISLPHCRSLLVDDFQIAVGRSVKGVEWHGQKVNVVILMISPVTPGGPQQHMELMKHIATRIRDSGLKGITGAGTPEKLAGVLGFELED